MRIAAGGIDAEEDEEEYCEAPKRRAAVAEEGEGNADNGAEPNHHSYVDAEVENEVACHAIGVDAPERRWLPLGNGYYAQHKNEKQQYRYC